MLATGFCVADCWLLVEVCDRASGKGREREGLLLFVEARRMEGSQGKDARCVWLHRHVDVCRTVREGPPHTCSTLRGARLPCESTNSGPICLTRTASLRHLQRTPVMHPADANSPAGQQVKNIITATTVFIPASRRHHSLSGDVRHGGMLS